ncbi:hypothetical protein E2C01_087397 [Portunus trituberculatus]|uniref:Uncharacterized protein n=1 Tax=Portunus trituberculatus TaxID=210409 RepID=A0A5B7JCD3_PORTR|nr:hypothetical protein [Portunus trituberculatus]
MVKVEDKKNAIEGSRAEVKVPSAEPCEPTALSATTREEVQDEARATPPTNHVRTHRSNKNASVTPVSAVEAKEREKENINSNSEAKQRNNRSFHAKGDEKYVASKEDAYVFKEEEEEDFEPSFRSLKKGRRRSHALKETQCSQEKQRVKSTSHNDGEERRLGSEEGLKASDKQTSEEKSSGDKSVTSEITKTGPEDQMKVSECGGRSEDSRAKASESEKVYEDKPGSEKTEADHTLPSQKEQKKEEDNQSTTKGQLT